MNAEIMDQRRGSNSLNLGVGITSMRERIHEFGRELAVTRRRQAAADAGSSEAMPRSRHEVRQATVSGHS